MKAPEEWVRGLPKGDEQWAINYIQSIKGKDRKLSFAFLKRAEGSSDRDHLVKLVSELQKSAQGKLWFLTMDETSRKRKSKANDPRKERRVLLSSDADKALRDLAKWDNLKYSDVVTQLLVTTKEKYVEARDSIRWEKKASTKEYSKLQGRQRELDEKEDELNRRTQEVADREEDLKQAEQGLEALLEALREIPGDAAISIEFREEDGTWMPVVRTKEKGTEMPEELQLEIQEAFGPYLDPDNA